MDFALQGGKVAVHCHAGLGRTGVLIACYLIYSSRITPEEAIHIVRIKRPRSVQTRGQISCVQEFAKFLKPVWVIFPLCDSFEVKPFTLQKYLVRQKHVLHGYEARELKFIPKIIFVTCKRLLELCGLDANKLRLTNNRLIGKPDDEIDSTDGDDELESSVNNSNEKTCDISASLEDLKGEFDTKNISSNEDCDGINEELSNSQSSGCMSQSSRRKSESDLCVEHKTNTRNHLELLREDTKPNEKELNCKIFKLTKHLNGNNLHEEQESSGNIVNEHITVDDVVAAVGGNNQVDDDVINKVENLQRLLNDSNKGWKMVKEETNLYILTTLMVSWIDCLMEPVLSSHDVESLVENKENPQEALLGLSKSQRGICECLLVTIFKLNPVDKNLREKALLRILTLLTQDRGVTKDDGTGNTSVPSETESRILNSSLMGKFLKFCILLYENWLKEVS
ncbi:tyrosine phosphatase domain-containing 1-like [Paramuricea clavata]|uniref:Tyrosine phosphatase domain-containing 1-like n=1 Tax=Paramuricea clavata TaxID=317549 RepID=A0A7D9ILY1_PARCT|nr:tyrosine phosphatase domain-containing 1-like [Paramuricea clavata]